VGIAEDEPQDIALTWGQGAVVGQDHAGGAVPGQHIPGRRADEGRTAVQGVEDALQARGDVAARLVADLGRATETQQEEVLALDLGEHQGLGYAIQHIGGWRAAAALFQPGVPGGADAGALRDFLAPQARRPPPPGGEAQGARIEPRAAILQIGAEAGVFDLRHGLLVHIPG
jgi:hypothetical protein